MYRICLRAFLCHFLGNIGNWCRASRFSLRCMRTLGICTVSFPSCFPWALLECGGQGGMLRPHCFSRPHPERQEPAASVLKSQRLLEFLSTLRAGWKPDWGKRGTGLISVNTCISVLLSPLLSQRPPVDQANLISFQELKKLVLLTPNLFLILVLAYKIQRPQIWWFKKLHSVLKALNTFVQWGEK